MTWEEVHRRSDAGRGQREARRERKRETGQGWAVTPKEPRRRGWITRTRHECAAAGRRLGTRACASRSSLFCGGDFRQGARPGGNIRDIYIVTKCTNAPNNRYEKTGGRAKTRG